MQIPLLTEQYLRQHRAYCFRGFPVPAHPQISFQIPVKDRGSYPWDGWTGHSKCCSKTEDSGQSGSAPPDQKKKCLCRKDRGNCIVLASLPYPAQVHAVQAPHHTAVHLSENSHKCESVLRLTEMRFSYVFPASAIDCDCRYGHSRSWQNGCFPGIHTYRK